MQRRMLICLLMALLASAVFSQTTAVVKGLKGKVELKISSGGWEPAQVGMTVPQGAFISTGFKSSALLEIGTSLLQVKQLTRMTLEELARKEGTVTTGLYLRVGKVSAKVKSAEGLDHDFKLRGPVSTAAVRGTDFDYDGYRLWVREGIVALINALGERRQILAMERGEVTSAGVILTAADLNEQDASVSLHAAEGGIPADVLPEATGGIVIRWE